MFPLTDSLLIFTLLILVILIAPLVAARIRIPDVVLLLFAGTLLGPNGFGVLERDSAITLFGSVGLIYIMFLAGLEIDIHRFLSTRQRSAIFGILTFIIPQGLGTLAGRYILGLDWRASVLLASMFASHTLLAYPIASRLGIARNEAVSVTVSATILTDTLALLVLAVIADSARGVQLGMLFWIGIAVGMAALLVITWWGIPRLTRWFFLNVTEAGGAQFLFVLVTVCACAYLSHYAKMEPIVGAFLAGAAFNRLIPEHSSLMNRVEFVGNSLFIPFFLISVGMLVDPGVLMGSARTWLVSGTMVVAVVATKYLAAWTAAKWFGYGSDARQVIFGLSVVQAAATLAAVLIGYELQIFDEAVLNGTIIMIAVTCPLGAWMVDRYGRRLVQREPQPVMPTGVEQRMLVPVANPETATRLLDLAFLLRSPAPPGMIDAITVVPDQSDIEDAVVQGEQLMGHCLTQSSGAEVVVHASVRVDVNPSDGIIRAAKELRSTLVLCGWMGPPALGNRLFGSVMNNLLERCASRLLVCRLVQPLNTNSRLLILWPALGERRTDRRPLLREVKQLAIQLRTELRVYVAGQEPEDLRSRLTGAKAERPLTVITCSSLTEAHSRLMHDAENTDLILLLGERRGASLWTPTLDRLPEQLAARKPRNNLLVAYPALENEWEDTYSEVEDHELGSLLLHPTEISGSTSVEEALRQMTTQAFTGDAGRAAEVMRVLLVSATSFPAPLSDDVVLLHGHSELVQEPTVLVGKGEGRWELSGIPGTPNVLLALLSPRDLSPERHLGWLRYLARKFYSPSVSERIGRAETAAEICAILGESQLGETAGDS